MNNRRNLILFAVFFIIYEFNAYISNDMIMPGMIKVVTEFNSPVENIAKSLSLFIIGGSSLQIFLGPLCDRYGKRNILLIGNVFFLIASGVIPFVLNIDQFLAARFFQGFGLCFIFIGYAMIHESFDDKSAVKLCSLVSNISIFAPLVGPVIGSAIILAANWRYVFIITAILAITSLIGLAKNMPNNKPSRKAMTLKEILQTYLKIIRTRPLLQGGLIIAVSSLPLITWIGLAPILVMKTMGKSFGYYIVYQTLVFGGFIVSSISIQFMAGRISFYKLITRGSLIAICGLAISLIFSSIHIVFILGLFLASFGIGIFNGSIFRIAITSTGQSNSMSAATLNIIQSTVLAGGLEVLNVLCSKFGYSLFGFALLNLGAGIILLGLCLNFAKLVKLRAWQ
ncbi:MAG: transporter, family, multidrug/chloramphenicol efflux transport protein [Pseudomonadota bacterium]|jgi:DHA1 family multidrug/chloramphenicol efflux transport protein-like MFS transporter|nr:MFS transporter [Burkholderiales bacterium]MBP9768015.1 MFS transporter [Burkholderiales bacterium]MDQ5948003.1 transporter, family, multidrug/chloramphenicol efflux transport protein [Pseudomonadota bacterium]